jgi:hypothetical protein
MPPEFETNPAPREQFGSRLGDAIGSLRQVTRSMPTIIALAISVTSLLISINTSQFNQTRQLRDRLTDTFDRYLSLQVNRYEFNLDAAESANNPQFAASYTDMANILMQQSRSLLFQAIEIAEQMEDRMNTTDYLTIGGGLMLTNDSSLAGEFYEKAIARAENDIETMRARGAYASYLMSMPTTIEQGRAEYERLVAHVEQMTTDEDSRHINLAQTYDTWARSEISGANFANALQMTNAACDAASEIVNTITRQNAIYSVNVGISYLQFSVQTAQQQGFEIDLLPQAIKLCEG